MLNAGLVGVSRRKSAVTTGRDGARQAPDLVDRNFTADQPNRLWVADITYIPTWGGFLYLAVVLDAFSRRIVGWSMATTLHMQVVLDALNMALWQRRPSGVIHHSDHGSQYTSIEFGKRCREAGVRPSMGSVGDAYDNLWTPPAARRSVGVGGLDARIYPACCWSDRAPGLDGSPQLVAL
jgi:putative transposase